MSLRIMSNNVWNYDCNNEAWANRGEDCSATARAPYLVKAYLETMPDIIGTQELTNLMTKEILLGMQAQGVRYTVIWGNYTGIFYRADKLDLIYNDYMVFPKRYDGFEGEFNDSDSKSANICVFKKKDTGEVFAFATTHLWWQPEGLPGDPMYLREWWEGVGDKWYLPGSNAVRKIQLNMVLDRLEELHREYGCPVIVLGDMNNDYLSPAVRNAISRGFSHAHDIATGRVCEENGYHHCTPRGYSPYIPYSFEEGIDHIFVKYQPRDFVINFDRSTPEWYAPISDHYPVWIDVNI